MEPLVQRCPPSLATFALACLLPGFTGCESSPSTGVDDESGLADGPSESMCEGAVVDLLTNKYHCGTCGLECVGAELDDPELDLDTPACIAGVCQSAWGFCSDLSTFAGSSCQELCPKGCVQDGCQGQTLTLRRDVNSIGISSTCEYDSSIMEVQAGYQCADALPAATAEGLNIDFFSCCCAPA